MRKATGGGVFPTPAITLQNTTAPENRETLSAGFSTRLELPEHLHEESTVVSQQLEIFCEVSNYNADLRIHRVLTKDSDKAVVSLLASPILAAVEPSATPSKALTNPLEQWLGTLAKAGTSPRHSIRSSMKVEALYREVSGFDTGVQRCTSLSKTGSPSVLSANAKAGEKALLHATGKRQSNRCHINPGLQDCFPQAASRYPGNVTKTTDPSIDITDRPGTHQSEDAENLAARIYGLLTSADPFQDVNGTILCVLMQILYGALYFDPSGSFWSCGSGKTSTQSTHSRDSQKAPRRSRKRRLERDREIGSDDCAGDDSETGKSKRWKANDITLQGTRRRLACLHCKNRLSYGDELKCVSWSNPNIDTVLRVCAFSFLRSLLSLRIYIGTVC